MVFASGTFTVVNGKIREVNNFSGSFRGNKKHLDYSLKVLRNHGLKIDEKTSIISYSKEVSSSKHSQDIDRLELIRGNFIHPNRKYIRTILISLYRQLYDSYPSKNFFGALDIHTLSV